MRMLWAGGLAAWVLVAGAWGQTTPERVGVIHCTDLFHPHDDPDDHFDLACLYGIAGIELKAVILDDGAKQGERSGRVAVEQMNRITGRQVPCAAGLRAGESGAGAMSAGMELLLKTLRESEQKVVLTVVGSCRDVAEAYRREPDLMRAKVSKVFLFAGEADEKAAYFEWNVNLDKAGYITLLRSDLPVWWVPCFDGGAGVNNGRASFWKARHAAIVGGCGDEMMQYFLYMIEKRDPKQVDPVGSLSLKPEAAAKESLLGAERNLWGCAAFLAVAGKAVEWEGKAVFGFEEVMVAVGDDARIRYGGEGARKVMRYVVRDREHYGEAMTRATGEILAGLGKGNHR